MKKHILRSIALLPVLSTALPSCSVAMAANKSGTDVSQVQAARSRGQILATGAKIISSEKDPKGNLVETYTVQKEKGSTVRAIMHGVLDVSTFGIWEAIGTPIEGALNKTEYFTIKVIYDKDEAIQRVELI